MNLNRGILILSILILLLVSGASGVTIVINDGTASLSIAATPDGRAAVSVVAAVNPGTYSSTMSASDAGDVSAGQESLITDAGSALSLSAAFSPGGASAITGARVNQGDITTTQTAQSSSGPGVSVEQSSTVAGQSGRAGSVATDSEGNRAYQVADFWGGILDVNQSAVTSNSAAATQDGSFCGLHAVTRGSALAVDGQRSNTRSGVFLGATTFSNAATASGDSTTASQDVTIAGLVGSAQAGASDDRGNFAMQSASFVGGVLNTNQTADTFSSANAAQTGDFVGLGATVNGFARSTEGDISLTHSGVVTGGMTFDNAAKAQDINTTASQKVMIAGLLGKAGADAFDQNGNIATQDVVFGAGVLNADQTADTFESAHSVQSGTFAGAGALTAGFAIAQDGDVSHTTAGVIVGGMTFENAATATRRTASASQDVAMAGLTGSAQAGARDDRGNFAMQSAEFAGGILSTEQTADTFSSANAGQTGEFVGVQADTTGFARSRDGDVSFTGSEVTVGGMTFENAATATRRTASASQDVTMAGVLGSAQAGARDDRGNFALQTVEFAGGILSTEQTADTFSSANAAQDGFFAGLHADTTGFARSRDGDVSFTRSEVTVGGMTFENAATATRRTASASQDVAMAAALGYARAGSDDGTNTTEVGAEVILGTLDVDQRANTTASAHAGQSGTVITLGDGRTWSEATSGDERSWTSAQVTTGLILLDSNNAAAGASTSAEQSVFVFGTNGRAASGSRDSINSTEVGAEITGGSLDLDAIIGLIWDPSNIREFLDSLLDGESEMGSGIIAMDQETDTSGSAHASQSGRVMAFADGRTWGNATSGDNHSWTDASVSSGFLTVDENRVTAGTSTSGVQDVRILGGSGDAWIGSTDGTNYTEVGAGFTSGSMAESWLLVPLGFYSQETHTGSSASATQSGLISAISGTGNTWGNAVSGDTHSWTNASVVSGTLNVDENTMTAGTSTSGVQDVRILGNSGDAWAGSSDGTNYAEVGAGFTNGRLTMTQLTNTTASAYATQSGLISAISGTGNTWGNAVSGDTHSWTNASVSRGLLTVGENTVTAGGSTSGVQDVYISALGGSGDAWVGSTDGTNNASVRAGFTSGSMAESYILGVPQGYFSQGTNTGSSAYATQSGALSVSHGGGTGHTWGEATSGANRSWASANVTSGMLTIGENTMTAGTTTSGVQNLRITGPLNTAARGEAWVGSTDGTNYAEVGAGFTSGSMAESYSGLGVPQGYFSQTTNTEASAIANQTGRIRSFDTTLGGAWTWNEAGNESGRQVYVETKARSQGVGTTITVTNAGAYSSDAIAQALESKSRTGGASITYTFANNLIPPAKVGTPNSGGTTTATAWATDTDKFATWG